MGRTCGICVHPEREAIDRDIVAGVTQRTVALKWHVSRDTVQRHSKRHVSPSLVAMQAHREEQGATTLLARVESLITRTERLLTAAEASGAVSTALAAVREQRELLRLLGAASGELSTTPTVTLNLISSEEFIAVRSEIFARLTPFPEAKAEVVAGLLALEAGPS